MNESIILSVIIPVYNAEKTIEKCIKSIYFDFPFEIIAINDGSKDESEKILNNLSLICDNLKVIHKSNGGVSSARNIGLDNAKGKYITFLDSDDCFIDCDIDLKMIDDKLDIIIFSYKKKPQYFFNAPKLIKNELTLTRDEFLQSIYYNEKYFYVKNFACGKFISRKVIDKSRFNTSFSYGEDAMFLCECISKSKTIRIVPQFIFEYNILSESSLSKREYKSWDIMYYCNWFLAYCFVDNQNCFRFIMNNLIRQYEKAHDINDFKLLLKFSDSAVPAKYKHSISELKINETKYLKKMVDREIYKNNLQSYIKRMIKKMVR